MNHGQEVGSPETLKFPFVLLPDSVSQHYKLPGPFWVLNLSLWVLQIGFFQLSAQLSLFQDPISMALLMYLLAFLIYGFLFLCLQVSLFFKTKQKTCLSSPFGSGDRHD